MTHRPGSEPWGITRTITFVVERDTLAQLGKFLPLAVLAGALVLTALVYGPTRDYTLLFDDALDLPRTENHSYWQILSEPFPGFGYYRPVPYLIFKATYDVTGKHHAGVLRTIALLAHAVSAWLLYLLLRRLTGSNWAIAAATLFLLFPFSYQTLSVIGAIGHVLVTLFLLTMLLLWYEGRKRGSPVWLAGAVALGILSVWTVEYGVLALPLLGGLELLLRHHSGHSRQPYPYLGMLASAHALYITLWFTMDKPASESVTFDDVARNAVIWLQAAAYPGTRFLNIIYTGLDVPGYRVVVLTSLLCLLAGIAGHLLLRQFWTGVIALGVAGVAFLPSMLMLSHEYVLSGPRLLYVAAPAIATFWALLGKAVYESVRVTMIWRLGIFAILAVTLLHSYSFIERRVDMFGSANEVVQSVVSLASENPGTDLLLLNTPSWFSFHSAADQEYPIGHLGAQAIPGYLGLDGLYYAVSGQSASIESASLAPDVSGWTYAFGPHGPFVDHHEVNNRIRAGAELYVVHLGDDGPWIHYPGRLDSGEEPPVDRQLAVFGDQLLLTDLDWRLNQGVLDLKMEWHVVAPLEADYQVQVEALSDAGDVVSVKREYALDGMSPPRLWEARDRVTDVFRVELENDEGIQEIRVSLPRTDDDALLEITDADIDVYEGERARFPASWPSD